MIERYNDKDSEGNELRIIEIPASVEVILDQAFLANPLETVIIYGKQDEGEFDAYGNDIWGGLDDTIVWIPVA